MVATVACPPSEASGSVQTFLDQGNHLP
jgi:hypothetical protein